MASFVPANGPSVTSGRPPRTRPVFAFVDDQQKALEFYTGELGFVPKTDIPLDEHRCLTVVSPEAPDAVELLLEPSDHPAVGPFEDALVADGIPFTSFRVEDVHAEYERLTALGVRFVPPPVPQGPRTSTTRAASHPDRRRGGGVARSSLGSAASLDAMRRRLVSALLLAALVAPALTGCAGNPVETLIEQGTGGSVDLGGGSVPEGFPAEVPLYDGEVTYGIGVGDGAGKAFNVTIRLPGQSAGEQIRADLEAAGFTLVGGTDPNSQGGAAYDSPDWGVVVVLTRDGDGWLANYTVTPKQSSGGQG